MLGGDCTVGGGTIAGHATTGERIGLVYFDSHAYPNVPSSVHEGALDWIGMAHMLGEDGAAPQRLGSARVSRCSTPTSWFCSVGTGAGDTVRA
jgi:arginase